jgi:hypothetical protein
MIFISSLLKMYQRKGRKMSKPLKLPSIKMNKRPIVPTTEVPESGQITEKAAIVAKTAKAALQETKVVCVKVEHIRPKYADLREWISDPNNVYIARKGVLLLDSPITGKKARYPEKDSLFANPYKVKEHGLEKAIELYKAHLQNCIDNGTIKIGDLQALKGKNLGCWCAPGNPCHGHVVVDFINKYA